MLYLLKQKDIDKLKSLAEQTFSSYRSRQNFLPWYNQNIIRLNVKRTKCILDMKSTAWLLLSLFRELSST